MQGELKKAASTGDRVFDFRVLPARDRYKLLISTIVPRPIAWVVTLGRDGQLNAAPFSFFNAFSSDPPVVGIGVGNHDPGRPKDTRRNIQDMRQFVVNLVSEEMAQAMNITAIGFGPEVDELAQAGLDTRPSVHVKPPRIAGSPVAMECELMQIVELGDAGLVLARVVAMHIREDAVLDGGKRIDTAALRLIGRMHGNSYTRTSDLIQIDRISPADWWGRKADGEKP